jgi:hypothetical protein
MNGTEGKKDFLAFLTRVFYQSTKSSAATEEVYHIIVIVEVTQRTTFKHIQYRYQYKQHLFVFSSIQEESAAQPQ